jgi:hypothetical protein
MRQLEGSRIKGKGRRTEEQWNIGMMEKPLRVNGPRKKEKGKRYKWKG